MGLSAQQLFMQNNKINKKTTIGIGRTVLIERSLIARPIGNYPDTLAISDAFVAIEVPIATTNSGTIRGADPGMFLLHHGIITVIVLVAGM